MPIEDDKRELSALAIAETRADLLVLQEVDNLAVMQPFFANYVHRLSDVRYGHFRLIDGNDPRGIDVAFAARLDLFDHKKQVVARSHHEKTFGQMGVFTQDLIPFGITPDDLAFNRDCLEVMLDFVTTELVLYICHFKAIAEQVANYLKIKPDKSDPLSGNLVGTTNAIPAGGVTARNR